METTASTRTYNDLPGPSGLPFFDNALQIDLPRIHQQFEKWSDEFGRMYKISVPGRRLLVVSDHELIAAMLRDRPDSFLRSKKLADVWAELGLPVGLFIAEGEAWKRQRRIVMSGFDPTHVKNYYPAMIAVSERLSTRWRRAAQTGDAIDLQADLMRYTVDTIAGLAFGAKVDTLGSDGDVIQQHLDQIFPAIWARMFKPLPTWRWFPSAADRRLADSILQVNQAVNDFIVQATMLLAGDDTTANTLAWMLYLMWQNPETLARAVAEVQNVVGDNASSSLEQMAPLKYVEACANEAMRVKPVVPVSGLYTSREILIGDVRVPEGITISRLMRLNSVSNTHISKFRQTNFDAVRRWSTNLPWPIPCSLKTIAGDCNHLFTFCVSDYFGARRLT
jgi:cytochrome P450